MKKIKICIALIATVLYFPFVIAQSPVGKWTIFDEKTGDKKAITRLSVTDGLLNGEIIQVFPEADGAKKCINCSGSFKDKPILGMQFLWGLKEMKEGIWGDGHVLDPKTGKVYRVKITVENDKLYVRGYVGVSVLGRNQIWIRTA